MNLTSIEKTTIAIALRAAADLTRISGNDEEVGAKLDALANRVEHGPDEESETPAMRAAHALSALLNTRGTPDTKAFVATVTHDHRTLQQQAFGLFMACIDAWADHSKSGWYDDRNAFTVSLASVLAKTAREHGWTGRVPMI